MKFSANIRVPCYKMVDQVKKRGRNVKGTNVSKGVRHCSYDLRFKIVMMKHTEETNNCEEAQICF
jgi:hypothetical protein